LDAIRGAKPGWGSIDVVTLDPHERSIGRRLLACGVVRTEVAAAVRYKASAEDLAALGDHRLGKA
jgi:hypothetical protein